MSRFLAVLVLSLAASGTALACEGEGKCSKEHCNMPAGGTTAALPDGTKATLAVTGMKCGSCAEKVKTALLGVEGVKGANVDPATGKADVSYDSGKTNPDKLLAAVNGTGHFTATVATN